MTWQLQARDARSGRKKGNDGAGDGAVLWARPNWAPDWTVHRTAT
jgi:hypothetical protein